MADTIRKRLPSRKVLISGILKGKFISQEEGPNYVVTDNGNISRANIICTLVTKEDNNMVVDDGTGKISLRIFDNSVQVSSIEPGDLCLVIGWIREYNDERYIAPEIMRKVNDTRWMEVRRLELSAGSVIHEESVVEEKPVEDPVSEDLTLSDRIYSLIKDLDEGDGVSIDEVISNSKEEDAEKIILNLLKQGDIFEIKPGKVKVLE